MKGKYNHGINLEKEYNVESTSNIIFQRSLAKYVPKKELDHSKTREKLLENNTYTNVKCTSDDLKKYAQLKKKGLNDLDLYLKNYKRRYSKKNVLGKIDCYCEKKIFNNIDQIYKLAENGNYNKKTFKNIIIKKYGYKIILSSLFLLLGIIVPILSKFKEITLPKNENGWENLIPALNSAFFIPYFTIFILTLLYIFIKVVKYEKLKAGKGKMDRKEYICFCKDVFI